ncbi:MAG: cytidylate kinase-like family protein [Planctomycetales bacterium]|nr:cytidylate kinase-like family protein [Planctomycetales bacterium]
MLHVPAFDHQAEVHIRRSIERARSLAHARKEAGQVRAGQYVLISREAGAGGSDIAVSVAKLLGWEVLDHEIIDYMVEHYGASPKLLEAIDERRSPWLTEIVNSWTQDAGGMPTMKYVHRLHELFQLAASRGKVVIVGRGARFMLPRDGGLSVRIVAPLEHRIANTAAARGISTEQASQVVRKLDREREAFVREYFHHSADDPQFYDLIVNSEQLGKERVADLIAHVMRQQDSDA